MIKKFDLIVLSGFNRLENSDITFEVSEKEAGLEFNIVFLKELEITELYIELSFESPIVKWRNSDYTWNDLKNKRLIANDFSPKILALSNGFKIVAQDNQGCWEYNIESQCFRWYFYHPMLSPTLIFDEDNKRVFRTHLTIFGGTRIISGLLWSQGDVEEWARTPLGFVPTVCFTDHSDFDTLANLKKQREFFKENGIIVSKGFFLFDYTHKIETASFEDPETSLELREWEKDGHELVYHAFSQSYRGDKSKQEFTNFESPIGLKNISSYIDHGFHLYNFSKQSKPDLEKWYTHMESKGIKLIWNYVDSGEGNLFTLNQLNPEDFTLNKLWNSFRIHKSDGIPRKWVTLFRNVLMYGVGEEALSLSKQVKSEFKLLKKHKNFHYSKSLFSAILKAIKEIVNPEKDKKIFLDRNDVFTYSMFGPVFFKAPNQKETNIDMFQAVSVRDFDVVLSEKALQKLSDEKGVLIAHTYFSFLGLHHEGRLFENENLQVRESPANNFRFLGQLIKKELVWNPSVFDLHNFYIETKRINYKFLNSSIVIENFKGVKRVINN